MSADCCLQRRFRRCLNGTSADEPRSRVRPAPVSRVESTWHSRARLRASLNSSRRLARNTRQRQWRDICRQGRFEPHAHHIGFWRRGSPRDFFTVQF